MKLPEVISGGLSSATRKLLPREPSRIDIDQLARELDLESEAKKLAAGGLPPIDQTVLTIPEAKAVQRVEKARREAAAWATGRVDIVNEALARRDVLALVNHALSVERAFERKAASRIAEHDMLVKELAANAAVRQRELEEFRAHNYLTRPATYPEGSATFARYALLLALIVFEGAANAWFLSQGLESGLIGGFLAAGLFAAVNLVTAFILGKFAVPMVFHVNTALKGLGLIAIAFACFWMAAMGLTIAHFRDALMADMAEPARSAWTALQAAPFGLRDMMSWLLFLISVLFAVFALFDGLSSDDRYPGYGQVSRRARQSRDEYLDELQGTRRELEALKDEELGELERDMQKVHTLVSEYAGLLREKKWVRTKLEAALLDADSCLDGLLKIFRDTNERHRADRVRPAYFESRPRLQQLVLPDFGADDDRTMLSQQERMVERLTTAVEHARASIQVAFDKQADRLKPAEGHVRLTVAR